METYDITIKQEGRTLVDIELDQENILDQIHDLVLHLGLYNKFEAPIQITVYYMRQEETGEEREIFTEENTFIANTYLELHELREFSVIRNTFNLN